MSMETLLFALLREAVCGVPLTEEELAGLTPELLEPLVRLAHRHDLAHLAGHTLKKHKLLGKDPVSVQFDRKSMEAMYRYMQQREEYTLILKTLQDARIPHLPLKGSVLRDSYPQPWMRSSCDIDILVHPEDLSAAKETMMTRLQYTFGRWEDHDISLFSPGGTHLELHYDTIGEKNESGHCRDVLARVWEASAPAEEGSFRYVMSDAMFYFYHIAHMAKHFEAGGCGIRPFLDLWILNHKIPHRREDRLDLLRQGGLETFALAMEAVAEIWFNGREPDAFSLEIADFLLRGGTYGSTENATAVGFSKAGSGRRYWLRRVFMSYEDMKAYYPILIRHKWLTPFLQPVRWFRILFRGGMRQAKAELRSSQSAEKSAQAAGSLLKRLGLS